jgi:hydrogenase maturation protein HypF
LRRASLAGGDAAAHYPVQAAAGFLDQLDGLPDMLVQPFGFSERYRNALELVRKDVRTFATTSVGRLFDAAAALLGFTREVTFEGQAAIWLEHLACRGSFAEPYSFPFIEDELDFRPLLRAVAQDRARGRDVTQIARSFQRGIAQGLSDALNAVSREHGVDTVVLSGGVFQNELLLAELKSLLAGSLQVWTNHAVPPNDGGISLGQATLAAFGRFDGPAQMNDLPRH